MTLQLTDDLKQCGVVLLEDGMARMAIEDIDDGKVDGWIVHVDPECGWVTVDLTRKNRTPGGWGREYMTVRLVETMGPRPVDQS